MHFNGYRMKEFISNITKVIKENENSVILAEMASIEAKEMDYYNNTDNGLLDMHLCLDHV